MAGDCVRVSYFGPELIEWLEFFEAEVKFSVVPSLPSKFNALLYVFLVLFNSGIALRRDDREPALSSRAFDFDVKWLEEMRKARCSCVVIWYFDIGNLDYFSVVSCAAGFIENDVFVFDEGISASICAMNLITGSGRYFENFFICVSNITVVDGIIDRTFG